MKKTLLCYLTICLLSQALAGVNKANAQPLTRISIQVFYDELAPYGDWILDPVRGYVWVPWEHNFHPYYTNGYWEMTNYGNTWISLYTWGWVPFHYGRWTYDAFYGWIWLPGYDWAPAWVCWGWNDGYYGWAPLAPYVVINVYFNSYNCPYNWWVFTAPRYLYGPRHSSHYFVNSSEQMTRNSRFINTTTVDPETNTRYLSGPTAADILKATGEPVQTRTINRLGAASKTKVTDDHVSIYRPNISREETATPRIYYDNAQRPINGNQPVQPSRNTEPSYQRELPKTPARNETPDNIRLTPDRQAPDQRTPPPGSKPMPVPRTEPVKPQQQRVPPIEPTRRARPEPQQQPSRAPVEQRTFPNKKNQP